MLEDGFDAYGRVKSKKNSYNGEPTMKSPAVINFDEYELANVLVCADCCDPPHVRLMLDYSALNSACYRRQYREDDAYVLEREELEGAIGDCKPDPERALHTASILHEHLATKHGWPASPRSVPVSSGGVLFTMFDIYKNDIMWEWTDSLRIQIRNRTRMASARANDAKHATGNLEKGKRA